MKNQNALTGIKLLNRREVADAIGVHADTVKRWVKEGHFPAPRKIGPGRFGKVAWRAIDVRRWLRKRQSQENEHE